MLEGDAIISQAHRPSPPYSMISKLAIIFPPCPAFAFFPSSVSATLIVLRPGWRPVPKIKGTSNHRRSDEPSQAFGKPSARSKIWPFNTKEICEE